MESNLNQLQEILLYLIYIFIFIMLCVIVKFFVDEHKVKKELYKDYKKHFPVPEKLLTFLHPEGMAGAKEVFDAVLKKLGLSRKSDDKILYLIQGFLEEDIESLEEKGLVKLRPALFFTAK